jgi:uncharacterized protein
LGFLAKIWVTIHFYRYSRSAAPQNMSGAEIAQSWLDAQGLTDVRIEASDGLLGDYYDPNSKTLHLTPGVYYPSSLTAAGIAAHEIGHALQDANQYWGIKVRSIAAPAVQIGSWVGLLLFVLGLIFLGETVSRIGLALFAAVAVIALATLPIELDASRRAKTLLLGGDHAANKETQPLQQLLNTSTLIYVAAVIQPLTAVPYYLFTAFLPSTLWHPKEQQPSR